MPRQPETEPIIMPAAPADQDDLGVQAYLDAFGAAVTAGDGKTIAKMWDVPAFVIGDEMVKVISDSAEIEHFFGGARAQYNDRGVTDTRADIVRVDEISDRIVSVRVRWPHLNAQGLEVGAETSTYTLRRDDDGEWKLRVAIMHGAEALN